MVMIPTQSLRKSAVITSKGKSGIKKGYKVSKYKTQKDSAQLLERKSP